MSINNLNIFLLIGQSNMAGRGRSGDVAALRHRQAWMFRQERWIPAEEPIHTDKPTLAGIGLSMSFAVELINRGRCASVGLVACACGGTSLSQWMPGSELYQNAVSTTRHALSQGKLSGILWHQGEGDSGEIKLASSYAPRFQQLIKRLRQDLAAEDVPVMAGELGSFLQNHEKCSLFNIVNQQLDSLVGTLPRYACVSAAGLSDNGDNLHFDAQSLRTFGRRYADKYEELAGLSYP